MQCMHSRVASLRLEGNLVIIIITQPDASQSTNILMLCFLLFYCTSNLPDHGVESYRKDPEDWALAWEKKFTQIFRQFLP